VFEKFVGIELMLCVMLCACSAIIFSRLFGLEFAKKNYFENRVSIPKGCKKSRLLTSFQVTAGLLAALNELTLFAYNF